MFFMQNKLVILSTVLFWIMIVKDYIDIHISTRQSRESIRVPTRMKCDLVWFYYYFHFL